MAIPWVFLGRPLGLKWLNMQLGVIKIEGSLKELGGDLGGLWRFVGDPLGRPLRPKPPKMQ